MRTPRRDAGHEPAGRRAVTPRSTSPVRSAPAGSGAHQPHSELVDVFLVRYIEWREACGDLRATNALWAAADRGHASSAFAAHCAALEREEAAAAAYATAATAIADCADRSTGT